MKFKFKSIFDRVLNLFKKTQKPCGKRPHRYSKNAWRYVAAGKMTPATALMLRLCR